MNQETIKDTTGPYGSCQRHALTPAQQAWAYLQSTSVHSREAWVIIGKELLEARRSIPSNNKFGEWCRDMGFTMSRNARTDAMWLAENFDSVAQWLCNAQSDIVHPTNIRAAYNEALKPEHLEQPEQLEQPESVPKQTQSAATNPITKTTTDEDDELVFGRSLKGMSNEAIAKHIIKHMPSPKWDTDSIISEEQKSRDILIGMQFKILGGMEVTDTTLDYEISKVKKGINISLLSETIKGKIVDELNNGHTKEEAFQKAKLAIEQQLNEMIQTISQEFNNSLKQLEQIKHKLDKVDDNMLSIVFRPTSNVNEALNAANFVMKKLA